MTAAVFAEQRAGAGAVFAHQYLYLPLVPTAQNHAFTDGPDPVERARLSAHADYEQEIQEVLDIIAALAAAGVLQ